MTKARSLQAQCENAPRFGRGSRVDKSLSESLLSPGCCLFVNVQTAFLIVVEVLVEVSYILYRA